MKRWKNILISIIYLPLIFFTFSWWQNKNIEKIQKFNIYLKEKAHMESIISNNKLEVFPKNKESLEYLIRLNLCVEKIEKINERFKCTCIPEGDFPIFILQKPLQDSRCFFLGESCGK